MLLAVLLIAALHQATPVEQLHPRYIPAPPATPRQFNAATAKAFNVTARRFEFLFNPAPFVVNQGDSVTLRIRADDTSHGFFLESYMTEGVAIVEGDTVEVNFVANTAGTFTYACTVVCGDGHTSMFGQLAVVSAENPGPVIKSFTPASGPTSGGAIVAITGSNFQNGATVKFGDSEALTVLVNSSSSITAVTRARAAGTVLIVVTNPDGRSVASASTYTFGTPSAPAKRRRAARPQSH